MRGERGKIESSGETASDIVGISEEQMSAFFGYKKGRFNIRRTNDPDGEVNLHQKRNPLNLSGDLVHLTHESAA